MLTAVVTQLGASVSVELLDAQLPQGRVVAAEEVEVPESDLNPIAPEMKEIIWGFGPFLVFLFLMRYLLYPRLSKGMDSRAEGIRSDYEEADALRSGARAEVAEYESKLAAVKAEAASRVEVARQQLETERQAAITELNSRLAEVRATATTEAEAAKLAVRDQIESAVADVAGRAGELATGRAPSAELVQRAVSEVMAR